ncbi:helix-turn-helix transcriptional regulator [Streptomyces sp. NPDC049744]|uniref:helix-turn-helix domain-containing protein n=1 Tax=Streptomyces sp. NPDC049744 TaxID=3154359 RepID=UPI00341C377E
MGRRENPVDHSRPARGRLAEYLRLRRQSAAMTYRELARATGLSPATLKRAASGTVVPRHTTVEVYVESCGGGAAQVQYAGELWRHARIEERGRLSGLHAPRPELISDAADLSRALEVVWEQAGAPSLRDIRDRSGNPLALPVSSAARIVNRDAIPADDQQLRAFLAGCGVPPDQHATWTAAFAKATTTHELPQEPATADRPVERRLLRMASAHAGGPGTRTSSQAWRRLAELLPPAALDEAVALGMHSYLASQASLNGKSPNAPLAWQPDLFTTHDGQYIAVEVKTLSSRGRGGPAAGGSANKPRTPAGGAPPTSRDRVQRPRPATHRLTAAR